MITYIVVLVVIAVMLLASFRALAGGRTVAGTDYGGLLATLASATEAQLASLDGALRDPGGGGGGAPEIVEVAASARKRLSGIQQELARFDVEGALDARVDTARALLRTAIEDLGWACRMIEPGTFADNPGIQRAVSVLRDHGETCLRGAQDLASDFLAAAGSPRPAS